MQIARWLGLSCRSSCNCSRCVLRAYRGEGLLKIRKKQGIYGGACSDVRTSLCVRRFDLQGKIQRFSFF
jgi:hypothetical protein